MIWVNLQLDSQLAVQSDFTTVTAGSGNASKRTNSILLNTADFVDEYKVLTNWETVEYQGWKLPSTSDPHTGVGSSQLVVA